MNLDSYDEWKTDYSVSLNYEGYCEECGCNTEDMYNDEICNECNNFKEISAI